MALDEGKMGKKDADRVEGQYTMRKVDDVALARRAAAVKRGYCGYGLFGDPGAPHLERACSAIGDIMADGKLGHDAYAVLLAAPQAKAAPLLELLDVIDLVGVTVASKVRVLRLAFLHERSGDSYIEH